MLFNTIFAIFLLSINLFQFLTTPYNVFQRVFYYNLFFASSIVCICINSFDYLWEVLSIFSSLVIFIDFIAKIYNNECVMYLLSGCVCEVDRLGN